MLDARADLTDIKKYDDSMLIDELRRRGRLKVSDRKTNTGVMGDGTGWIDSLVCYSTGWQVEAEIYAPPEED